MGVGKVFAIIGGVLGVFSIVLFYVFPDLFCLWRYFDAIDPHYIGGFGVEVTDSYFYTHSTSTNDIALILVGVLLVAGGVAAFGGALGKFKNLCIIGGTLMLLGPILFSIELVVRSNYFSVWEPVEYENLFWGSISYLNTSEYWNIGVSFYMGAGGGILGIIGGVTL